MTTHVTQPLETIADLIRSRSLDQAASALHRLVSKKNAKNVDWRKAASLASTLGDQDLALAALQKWRGENTSDPLRQVAVINALGAVARHKEAARLAHKLQRDARAAAEGFYLEGYYQARFGRTDKALALYRQALAAAPHHTPAWEQIALLKGYQDFDADLQEMERLANAGLKPAQLVPLHYALGRAYDYAGEYGASFRHTETGAALREQLSPFNVQPQVDYYSRLQISFTADRLERLGNDNGGSGAIFIISTPRSGTTLVEQILATASGMTATGEHLLMRVATLALASMEPPDMARAEEFDLRSWRQIAHTYLSAVQRRYGVRESFTDKSMLNHNYAGIIRILFPEAKFVWLKRDPRDVAWSCFRSRISGNQWTQTLENCGRYLQSHEALCAHWQDVFGENLLAISYEDLVTSPDETTQRLFTFAGLERPEDWGDFYLGKNPVATASLAQVREPLTGSAVGSWRRYEKFLSPVYEQLGLGTAAA